MTGWQSGLRQQKAMKNGSVGLQWPWCALNEKLIIILVRTTLSRLDRDQDIQDGAQRHHPIRQGSSSPSRPVTMPTMALPGRTAMTVPPAGHGGMHHRRAIDDAWWRCVINTGWWHHDHRTGHPDMGVNRSMSDARRNDHRRLYSHRVSAAHLSQSQGQCPKPSRSPQPSLIEKFRHAFSCRVPGAH